MKIYQNSQGWIDLELPLNIEAKADSKGRLLEPITSQRLLELINSIQVCRSGGAIWTCCPVVSELGLYKADVWIDGHIRTVKVWVIPTLESE